MKIYRPSDTCFDEMKSRMNRRALPEDSVRDTVNAIIQDVSARGDEALFDYAARFDRVHLDPSSLFVTEAELAGAEAAVEDSVKEAIAASLANIHYFSDRSRRQDWSGVNARVWRWRNASFRMTAWAFIFQAGRLPWCPRPS